MPTPHANAVRRYYDHNTRRFLRLGGGLQLTGITLSAEQARRVDQRSVRGGHALRQCLRWGLTRYHLLLFEKPYQ